MKIQIFILVLSILFSLTAQAQFTIDPEKVCMGREIGDKRAIKSALSLINDDSLYIKSIQLDIPSLTGSRRVVSVTVSKDLSPNNNEILNIEVAWDCSGSVLQVRKLF